MLARYLPLTLLIVTALAGQPPLAPARQQQPGAIQVQERQPEPTAPVAMTFYLPYDAKLEILDQVMPGQGVARKMNSPPVTLGKTYRYRFRATWTEGSVARAVEREVLVTAGQSIDVELFDDRLTTEEQAALDAVNAQRARAQAQPLEAHPRLMHAAREHSANMARNRQLNHTLDGLTFAQRIDAVGYPQAESGENIAEGAATVDDAMTMWINSPPHRGNMLNPRFAHFGVGVATTADGRRFWTQLFALPAKP